MRNDNLPVRINRLNDLAHNLWTSWHPQARILFQSLNYPAWRASGHNPVRELLETTPAQFEELSRDAEFLGIYDAAVEAFDKDMADGHFWFKKKYNDLLPGPIAYFAAEFAFHTSLPIYAGGLGVLTGDTVKEATDIGVPLVAVGLMYPQGYFHQRISPEGWQEETYEQLDFERSPIEQCPFPATCGPLVEVQFGDKSLFVGVWLAKVGRVNVYLLDTNVELNSPTDRQLSARLYAADREQRLQQELVLGVGGVRVLRTLGIQPVIWHGNEGHTSFMMLERVREEVEKGLSFKDAVQSVRTNSVFTTHTPVPAGHDVFSEALMEKYFRKFWTGMGIERTEFMKLGQYDGAAPSTFNMTTLALKLSAQANGVSRMHGRVSRKMWQVMWPDLFEEDVPIISVTNGVHAPTWIAQELIDLHDKHAGTSLIEKHDETDICRHIDDIPNKELWECHVNLKRKLFHIILERAQQRWAAGSSTAEQVIAMGALLDPDALTIGFVRRLVEYKRPALLFHDIERIQKIINSVHQPVQVIFAGKSHPADFPSKHLLHKIYSIALDRHFQGRVVFVEDHDIHIAHYLTQGVDVWLNNPRRLQEASGTSGMKAGMNGVLNLSDAAGWWQEGYNGKNGWRIGDDIRAATYVDDDEKDAADCYDLLEKQVIPLYYRRDVDNVPEEWVKMMKESIKTIVPAFSTRRMLKEYTEKMYLPAYQSSKMK